MHRLFPLSLLLFVACSGTDGEEPFVRPEVCDDGVDNNGNGLVDCEDDAFCQGQNCDAPDTDEDTDVPLPDLEIVFNPTECCDFQFQQGDCPKSIGTFTIVNRSTTLDAEVDTSCDLVNSSSAIVWQIQGSGSANPFIVNEPLYADSSMTLEGFFNCSVNQEFTTQCRVKVANEDDSEDLEFEATGTPVAR